LNAAESVAVAECARTERCDLIGRGLRDESREDCLVRVRAKWLGQLNEKACANDVSLDACLRELRGEDCAVLFDQSRRAVVCRTENLLRVKVDSSTWLG